MKKLPEDKREVLQLARENEKFAALLGRYLLAVEKAKLDRDAAEFDSGLFVEWINEKKVYDWNADGEDFDIKKVEWYHGEGLYLTTDMGDAPETIYDVDPLCEFTTYGIFDTLTLNFLED